MTSRSLAVAIGSALLLCGACETASPTNIVVENAYPPSGNGSASTVVYGLWWNTTLFDNSILPGDQSGRKRTLFGSDYAYAVLASANGERAHDFIPIRSKKELTVSRGRTLHIDVSDKTFAGRCGGGNPLSQHDADFITQRIFPGTFANLLYDAETCSSTPIAPDAGIDPEHDSGDDVDGGG